LARLLKGDAQLGLAFDLPPADKKRDVKYWRARQISADPWKDSGCDFAMMIRRPLGPNDPGRKVADKKIEDMAFESYNEVNKL
jgi:hypothetical protein